MDPVEFKRTKAREFGATHVFGSSDEAQQAVVEMTRGQAAAIVGKGGQ